MIWSLPLPGVTESLGLQQLAADLGEGETGRDADLVVLLALAEAVLLDAEVLAHQLRADRDAWIGASLETTSRATLRQIEAELALERAHAGLRA